MTILQTRRSRERSLCTRLHLCRLLISLRLLFLLRLHSLSFFPRVRTPCGHGAQVIVEGREEQTDGGERNEGPKTNPKPNTQARRPKLHHLVVFPLHKVKHVKLRLVAISGPEFAKEEDCSASCVHGKPPRRLQTDFPYQVLVTSGHTTVWQNKVTLQVRCLAMLQQWL